MWIQRLPEPDSRPLGVGDLRRLPKGRERTSLLPHTGMNHSLNVAWFALRCLGYALAHPPRKAPR